ncbi:MAG TPA: amidohydrolase [Bacteroidia bacterium]
MQALNFTVIQANLIWEDIDANLSLMESLLAKIQQTDVIVLPEMFTTGFSMQAEKLAKDSYAKGLAWMKAIAAAKHSAVIGSLMIERDGKYYNSLAFVNPEGKVEWYDKRHLFTPGEESKHYSKGDKRLIIDYKGWKICPLICYDLRFPVFSRNDVEYDLLIYVANWPEKRNYAWQQLLKARAIENQCYVIACNRIGVDGNGVNHIGNSGIINFMGEEIGFGDAENCFQFNLSKAPLMEIRQQFPVLNDRDNFKLI